MLAIVAATSLMAGAAFAAPALSVTTVTLPAATAHAPYAIALGATGGTLPYTWSLDTGTLPDGLTMGGAGVISGTPGTAGVTDFVVKVTDDDGTSATQAVSITVNPPLSITTLALPDGTVGLPYSAAVTATGGTAPLAWSIPSGALPDGLTMDATGAISGTPTTAGHSAFSARVDDDAAADATAALTIDVKPPVAIATASLPAATVGTPYAATLNAVNGTTPYTWSIAVGALPAGLTVDAAGAISGTPTTAGTSTFTARVDDGAGSFAMHDLSIAVADRPPVTTPPPPPPPPADPRITLTASDAAPRGRAWVKLTARIAPQPSGPTVVVLIDVTHHNVVVQACGWVKTCEGRVREGRGARTYRAAIVDLSRQHFGRVIAASSLVTVTWR